MDMEICCGGGADVLGLTNVVGAGVTRSVEDADDVGSGIVTTGAANGAI